MLITFKYPNGKNLIEINIFIMFLIIFSLFWGVRLINVLSMCKIYQCKWCQRYSDKLSWKVVIESNQPRFTTNNNLLYQE